MWKKSIALVASVFLLSACGSNLPAQSTEDSQTHKLKIVTTIPPLYSLTANLVEGTEADLENIVTPGLSVHDFQLKPSMVEALEKADLVIKNGVDLEEFLEDATSFSNGKIVDTSEGVKLIKFVEEEHQDGEEEHADEHHHGEYDPHIWLAPGNAIKQAKNIKEALVEIDPANAQTYEQNFENLKERLSQLQLRNFRRIQAAKVPAYLVFHDAYAYFEQAFGLENAAFVQETPEKPLPPQSLKKLTDLIGEKNIKVVFAEPQFEPQVIQALIDDFGLQLSELDPLGKDLSKDAYFNLIDQNVSNILKAFEEN